MTTVRIFPRGNNNGYTDLDYSIYDLLIEKIAKAVNKKQDCLSGQDQAWMYSLASNSNLHFTINPLLVTMMIHKAAYNEAFREELKLSILAWPEVITDLTLSNFGVTVSNKDLEASVQNRDFVAMLDKAKGVCDYRTSHYLNLDMLDNFTKAYAEIAAPVVQTSRVSVDDEESFSLGDFFTELTDSIREAIQPRERAKPRYYNRPNYEWSLDVDITPKKKKYLIRKDPERKGLKPGLRLFTK